MTKLGYAPSAIKTPAFVIDLKRLERNLQVISKVQAAAEVEIILALKAFAGWSTFPLIKKYLVGATASSLNEARLIYEEMGVKAHSYAPVYLPDEFDDLTALSSHLTFNSLGQLYQYKDRIQNGVSIGLRVNPEYSTVETDLYNPAVPGSRLGVLAGQLPEDITDLVDGLHVHTLCESDAKSTGELLQAIEHYFGKYLPNLKWLNLGGGHLMTKAAYDLDFLITVLTAFRQKYPQLKLILEPGSAIAWEVGELHTTVLDIVESGSVKTAMIDASFTAHMPDTLEMPYRPTILESSKAADAKYHYRIGGISCLAGDFMEVYPFDQALRVGDRLTFWDMIHYTMVKTTMFNGVRHPAIYISDQDDQLELLRSFSYEDFKQRLG
ncbi:MAG: carboxynorspermidine decarboxylase [Bacteroidota bacterium]